MEISSLLVDIIRIPAGFFAERVPVLRKMRLFAHGAAVVAAAVDRPPVAPADEDERVARVPQQRRGAHKAGRWQIGSFSVKHVAAHGESTVCCCMR